MVVAPTTPLEHSDNAMATRIETPLTHCFGCGGGTSFLRIDEPWTRRLLPLHLFHRAQLPSLCQHLSRCTEPQLANPIPYWRHPDASRAGPLFFAVSPPFHLSGSTVAKTRSTVAKTGSTASHHLLDAKSTAAPVFFSELYLKFLRV